MMGILRALCGALLLAAAGAGAASFPAIPTATVARSQFLIYPHYVDVSAQAVRWYSHAVNVNDATKGLAFSFIRVDQASGGGTTRSLDTAYETELRPGVVFDFTPTASTGVTVVTSSNVQYNTITTGSFAHEVPAMAAGLSLGKAIIFPASASDAHFDLIRVRGGTACAGGTETTVKSNVTPGSSALNPQTVTLDATLTAGDCLKVARNGGSGTVQIASIQLYDAAGTCTDPAQHYVAVTPALLATSVMMDGSTMDGAFAVAPTGSTPQFVGGPAHYGQDNGGGGYYSHFRNISLSATRGGAPWTIAAGMQTSRVAITITADVYYTVPVTAIGAYSVTYTFHPTHLALANALTMNEHTATGELYSSMLTFNSASLTHAGITTDGITLQEVTEDGTATGDGNFSAPQATADAAVTYGRATPAGQSIGLWNKVEYGGSIRYRDHNGRGTSPAPRFKNYNALYPATTTDSGSVATYGGRAAYFADGAAGPTAAGLAIVSQ